MLDGDEMLRAVSGGPLRVGARFAEDGTAAWTAQFGGPGVERDIRVARSSDGTSTAAFAYSEALSFDGVEFPHVGDLDMALVHISSAGDTLWTRSIAAAGPHYPAGIAHTPTGDVVVFGAYGSMTDLGGPSALPIVAGDIKDFFVAKYAATTGALVWQRAIHADDNDDPGLGDIAIDAAGDIYLVGAFNTSIDFGDGPLTSATPGDNEGFLAKLDGRDGTVSWKRRMGGTASSIFLEDLVVPPGEAVYAVGNFGAPCNVGGSTMVPAGARDAFVAKFSNINGQFFWQRQIGGTGDDTAVAVTADVTGIYVAVSYETTASGVSFGGQALAGTGIGFETVVGALDSGGFVRWAQRFGSSGADIPGDLVNLANGTIAILGTFTSATITFGQFDLTNGGITNSYLALLSPATGLPTWAAPVRSNFSATADALAAAGNTVTLGGTFTTQVDVVGAPLVSAGGGDAFAAAIHLNQP